MASGSVRFYPVERIMIKLARGIKNKELVREHLEFCHRALNAIEEGKTGCQTYIDEYRETLKQYEL